MNHSMAVVISVVMIGFIIPYIVRRKVYQKLFDCLEDQNFNDFDVIIDGFFCRTVFKRYNREFLRLNRYMIQGDTQKIDTQFEWMFKNVSMNPKEQFAAAKKGFHYYIIHKNQKKAKFMLAAMKETFMNNNEVNRSMMLYDIMLMKKSDYIEEVKQMLNEIQSDCDYRSDESKQVRAGIFEYLLGLQYLYKGDEKNMYFYMDRAKKHCKETAFEEEIDALLKSK